MKLTKKEEQPDLGEPIRKTFETLPTVEEMAEAIKLSGQMGPSVEDAVRNIKRNTKEEEKKWVR